MRRAIGLTWYAPPGTRTSLDNRLVRALVGCLAELHRARQVVAVMPFRHRRLQPLGGGAGSGWTDYWLVVLADGVEPDGIWNALERATAMKLEADWAVLLRAEVLRPQPGIDMYYPRVGGLRREPRWHWLEYASSRPDMRPRLLPRSVSLLREGHSTLLRGRRRRALYRLRARPLPAES